jgi:hypothetical protein
MANKFALPKPPKGGVKQPKAGGSLAYKPKPSKGVKMPAFKYPFGGGKKK